MWTNTMPAAPGWYWVRIKGTEPQVCQLVDGVMWTSDRELGMAEKYLRNHCQVWSEPIRAPNADNPVKQVEQESEQREACRRLAALEGTMPDLQQIPRRKML